MADLSTQHLLFATEFIKCGNATQAAIKAGYSERTAKQQGSRLLTNVDIQRYIGKQKDNINRDLRSMFVDSAVDAYKVMISIMNDPASPPKDRLVAARDLLDRAGYKPVEQIKAEMDSTVTINIGIPDVAADG